MNEQPSLDTQGKIKAQFSKYILILRHPMIQTSKNTPDREHAKPLSEYESHAMMMVLQTLSLRRDTRTRVFGGVLDDCASQTAMNRVFSLYR
jgi:hypothetical protein